MIDSEKNYVDKSEYINGRLCFKEKGGAITEFSVMLVVLVPMALMIPMMGKVADMNSSTIQAARYAAWERTISDQGDKSDAQLKQEMQNRFFTKIDTGIQTGRGQLTDKQDQNPLWSGYGDKRMLVSAQDNIDSAMQASATPGKIAGEIADVMTTFTGIFSSFSDNADFNVNMNGLYRADVTAEVGSNKMGFEGTKNCGGQDDTNVFSCIRRHNVILTDTWSSANSDEAELRTRSLVPMAMFDNVSSVFNFIGKIPGLTEFGEFKPGYVDSDIIAPDRLGEYKGN